MDIAGKKLMAMNKHREGSEEKRELVDCLTDFLIEHKGKCARAGNLIKVSTNGRKQKQVFDSSIGSFLSILLESEVNSGSTRICGRENPIFFEFCRKIQYYMYRWDHYRLNLVRTFSSCAFHSHSCPLAR